jgi:SAM-dependent methyltransferase
LIQDEPAARRICELGGGANPALTLKQVERLGVECTLLDASESELATAPAGYARLRLDVCDENAAPTAEFDFVYSRMLAEHVRRPVEFHRTVHRMLRPGGRAFHFFPTLYSPVFAVNRLLPNWLTEPALLAIQPIRRRSGPLGKFPAYYRWRLGPCPGQIRRFQSVRFEVEEYWGFFGHGGDCTWGPGCDHRLPPLRRFHERLCRALVHRPVPWLTSYAYVLLRKPLAANLQERRAAPS